MNVPTNYRNVKGLGQLSACLQALQEDMRAKILEEGVKAAIQPILRAAKQNLRRSVRTGALYASMTTKTKSYPRNGKAVGLVGPDRGYYNGQAKAGKLGALYAGRPSNYAHLIEYGHVVVHPKKGETLRNKTASSIGWVQPRPFIRPAIITTSGEQGRAFASAIAEGFERTRAKMMKDGTHSA